MKQKKLEALLATYNCSASSDNEADSCYELVCKMIEKATGCKRWVASNVFAILADKTAYITPYMCKCISKQTGIEMNNVINIIFETITTIGYRVKTSNDYSGNTIIELI